MTDDFDFDAERSEEAAADAIRRAERAAKRAWKAAAIEAVYEVACDLPLFTTDDVWRILAATRENRALGGVMRRAAGLGYCEITDRTRRTERVTNHRRPVAVWRSLLA